MLTSIDINASSVRFAAVVALLALGACASDNGLSEHALRDLSPLAGDADADGRCFAAGEGSAESGEDRDGQVIRPFVDPPAQEDPSQ